LRHAGVLGGHQQLPDVRLVLDDVVPDGEQLAAYRRICGFTEDGPVPATFSHTLAFPLSLELMTSRAFPLPLDVRNALTQYRAVRADERLAVVVHAQDLRPHAKGLQFDLVADVLAGSEPVWHQVSTYLHRKGGSSRRSAPRLEDDARAREEPPLEEPPQQEVTRFYVEAAVSPRYAAVSGDRNPHHLHPLLARLFGFPRLLAHGMWTQARCLAELQRHLPQRFTITGSFERPLLLPACVVLTVGNREARWPYALLNDKMTKPYLTGAVDTCEQRLPMAS
jgi:acyl dehydratase